MSSSITLEKSKNLSIALAGNPNCGKTTLFNEITVLNNMLVTGLVLQLKKKRENIKKIRQ